MSASITWTRAIWAGVLAAAAFVAVSANVGLPNTGMADPSALVRAARSALANPATLPPSFRN